MAAESSGITKHQILLLKKSIIHAQCDEARRRNLNQKHYSLQLKSLSSCTSRSITDKTKTTDSLYPFPRSLNKEIEGSRSRALKRFMSFERSRHYKRKFDRVCHMNSRISQSRSCCAHIITKTRACLLKFELFSISQLPHLTGFH